MKFNERTSDKYADLKVLLSSEKAISIMYTGVPLVFLTGSHSNEIEVKVVFVTVGTPGVGEMVPSPMKIELKFVTRLKNSQLLKQLLLFFCKNKQTKQNK